MAVLIDARLLHFTLEACKGDREIALSRRLRVVKQAWHALQYAAEPCRADRGIVVSAVKQDWHAREHAAEAYRADNCCALPQLASSNDSSDVVEDRNFAASAKREDFILKMTLLSGHPSVHSSSKQEDNRACPYRMTPQAWAGEEP
eukprot:4782301-Amphidinium_carterae.1